MKRFTKTQKLDFINSIFSNTELDNFFIEAAERLCYDEYFTKLQPLENMSYRQLHTCFLRVKETYNLMKDIYFFW
jgi:hypothetical protein